ncbi:MAG: methyltransferase [Bacteroidota bacterium]
MTAMKVGTDGVLLGAWSCVPSSGNVLDIGTGTGLLALMIAQRCKSKVHAIEIDKDSFLQASENICNSPWSDRVTAGHISFNDFILTYTGLFDLIISNPPYFRHSLKPSHKGRILARHDDRLPREELLEGVSKLLKKDGLFSTILPYENAGDFISLAGTHNLFPVRKLIVYPKEGKPARRMLLTFSRHNKICEIETLHIETAERHQYSDAYKELTKEFYIRL